MKEKDNSNICVCDRQDVVGMVLATIGSCVLSFSMVLVPAFMISIYGFGGISSLVGNDASTNLDLGLWIPATCVGLAVSCAVALSLAYMRYPEKLSRRERTFLLFLVGTATACWFISVVLSAVLM